VKISQICQICGLFGSYAELLYKAKAYHVLNHDRLLVIELAIVGFIRILRIFSTLILQNPKNLTTPNSIYPQILRGHFFKPNQQQFDAQGEGYEPLHLFATFQIHAILSTQLPILLYNHLLNLSQLKFVLHYQMQQNHTIL
jgi:hypothetical protein